MKPAEKLKMYTLKHFLFYMGIAALAGAVIGALANAMAWGNGLIFGVGLFVGLLIVIIAMREGLFGVSTRRGDRARQRHA